MVDSLIRPSWQNPEGIGAISTTRLGGQSPAPWDSLNLGVNTGDSPENIESNRALLAQQMPEAQVQWLRQVHGSSGVVLQKGVLKDLPEADFSYTNERGIACAVLTADCLPILICDVAGTEIAAVHAGWRGLSSGVIANAVSQFKAPGTELTAWIGPSIGQNAFEVGADVVQAMSNAELLVSSDLDGLVVAHEQVSEKFFLDLAGIARINLSSLGVDKVYGGDLCSYSDSERFFSYRRDGETGRMASLIWIDR